MSVEEARSEVLAWEFGIEPTGIPLAENAAFVADLDRLILEVQAAMPCYGWPCEWNDTLPPGGFLITTKNLCPPHAARRTLAVELERKKVAV